MNHPPNRPFPDPGYFGDTQPGPTPFPNSSGPEVNNWQGAVGFPPGMTPRQGWAPAPPSSVGFPPGMTPRQGWAPAPPSSIGFPPGMAPAPGRGPGYAPPSTMPMRGNDDDFDDDFDLDAMNPAQGSFVPPWFPNSQLPPGVQSPWPQQPSGGTWQQPMQQGPGPVMPPPTWGGGQPGMAMPYGVSQHPYDASALKEAYNQMKLRHHHEEQAMKWAMNRAGIAMQLSSDDDSASTQSDDSSVMSDSSSSL